MIGPVYAGGGYTPTIKKIQNNNIKELEEWFDKYPDLVNEVTTGGATPLHMCGMSKFGESATTTIIKYGGNIDAYDTYGFQPIHRMSSNNLAIGIEALIIAGSNPLVKTLNGETALQIAKLSRAKDAVNVLQKFIK